jgi:general secretion pathway protein G
METRVMNEDIEVFRAALAMRRAAARGVTLVEVLIVVAIMAVIAGGVTVVAFPQFKKAKVDAAMVGCHAVKQAADLYQNLESTSDQCPTIQDLVRTKKIDGARTEDPWGMVYRIDCSSGEIRVCSNGNNRKPESTGVTVTGDDICDNYSQSDIKKVKDLM